MYGIPSEVLFVLGSFIIYLQLCMEMYYMYPGVQVHMYVPHTHVPFLIIHVTFEGIRWK